MRTLALSVFLFGHSVTCQIRQPDNDNTMGIRDSMIQGRCEYFLAAGEQCCSWSIIFANKI